MSSLYALQLDQIASQGAGVKALCRSMFLPAPDNMGLAAPYPACLTAHFPSCAGSFRGPALQGTGFARSDSGQELRPTHPACLTAYFPSLPHQQRSPFFFILHSYFFILQGRVSWDSSLRHYACPVRCGLRPIRFGTGAAPPHPPALRLIFRPYRISNAHLFSSFFILTSSFFKE